MHADVSATGSCKTSRFELTLSANDFTQPSSWLNTISGKASVQIFISVGPDGNETSMFEGLADGTFLDPIQKIARIQGRDYSALLSSSTYQESFCNRTSSEIVTSMATRHGFDMNIVPTSTLVGSYQNNGYNKMLLNAHSPIVSEWDLLKHLAKIENFEAFIRGRVLVFAPAALLFGNNIPLDPTMATKINFRKSCPLYDQINLAVKSWNSWLGQSSGYTDGSSSSEMSPDAVAISDNSAMEIAIVKPNLTDEVARSMALHYMDAINKRMLGVDIVMPGDTMISPYDVLTLSTGSAEFDTDYIVRSVRRHFSSTSGFSQHVQGYSTGSNSTSSEGSSLQ